MSTTTNKPIVDPKSDLESKISARTAVHKRPPKKPSPTPEAKTQYNLSDPDSRLMYRNKNSAYEQSYNAQASVNADGSQLVLSTH